MTSYAILNARPASAFLDPELFRTGFDNCADKREERYQKELARCADYTIFHIGANGTWSATTKDGASVSSYEGIGFHAYTADLLRAVLDSVCPFIVHRDDGKGINAFNIRMMQGMVTA